MNAKVALWKPLSVGWAGVGECPRLTEHPLLSRFGRVALSSSASSAVMSPAEVDVGAHACFG